MPRNKRAASGISTWFALAAGLCCTPVDDSGDANVPDPTATAQEEAQAAPAPPEPAEAEASPEEPTEPAWQPRDDDKVQPQQPLENPEALSSFYEALAKADDGEQKVARVVHIGASMIGGDDLTAVLRERFQTRFGDGGAGLVLLSRYMKNYLHRWVRLEGEGWKHCYIAFRCMPDGHYGLGGTTFWASKDAETTIATRNDELGDEVAHYEFWYLAKPGGGRVELMIDGKDRHVVDTRAEVVEDRYHAIDVEPGPHKIRVRPVGYGSSRAYGVVLETQGPGVVWDQFSMLGVFTKKMMAWDADHIAGQIKHRDPHLIAFTYGGNDTRRVANGKLSHERYVEEYTQVVEHVRAGKPDASCLVIGMTDRGKSLNFDIRPEHVEVVVSAQREAAKKTGCAFFDTYAAMGGGGSLRAWKNADPPLAAKDLKHLNHRGRVKLGGWIYDAIMAGYVAHRTDGD
jgi:lysophospholipase L1-like esterase